jgi:hypothetical protein
MNKIRLVTVTGSRVETLWHMLNHYKDLVDEMYVVVYEWEGKNIYNEVHKTIYCIRSLNNTYRRTN